MSVVCNVSDKEGTRQIILSKGAPEILCNYMKDKPSEYNDIYLKHAKEGSRVLAMAYKIMPQKMSQDRVN